MKIILQGLLVIIFATLSVLGLPALAQTPDGETPANEGICDGLVGMTPGLYGLCVAFCEAQDAEATFDEASGEVTFAPGSKPSNQKLLDIYNKKMDVGDPPMPCVNIVANECPCWTSEEINNVGGNTTLPGDMCTQETTAYQQIQLKGGDTGTNIAERAAVDFGDMQWCYLEQLDYSSGIPQFQPPRFMNVYGEENEACRQSIAAVCASRGIPVQ